MRVVEAIRFGGPEVLVAADAPEPVAGPGQVVIDVAVADTLFVETQIRRGEHGEYFTVNPPYVPGGGVGGEVRSVGQGVDASWIGRRVVTRLGEGGYAERATADADGLIPIPAGLGLPEAVAFIHDGLTAQRLLEHAKIQPGEWVLVVAAGGGMGTQLVQLAHAAGAHVIGAARGRRKLDLVRELGADVVLDYTDPGWAEQAREATGGRGPDVVLDGAGGEVGVAAFGITADGGRFSAHGAPSGGFAPIDPDEAERRGVELRGIADLQVTPAEGKRLIERALADAAAGRVKPVIGQTFPLEQAADAHAAIEGRGVIGKTLLLV